MLPFDGMKHSCSRRLVSAAAVVMVMISNSAAGGEVLTLRDAVARALKYAPAVEQAETQRDLSSAKTREQRAPLFPSVEAGTEYYQAPGYDEVITNRGLSAALAALNYTAWDWGRRDANWRAAKYVEEVARLGIVATRAQVAFDTTIAYDDLLRARTAERELTASLARVRDYVDTVHHLRRSGRSIANDVLKIQSTGDATELALSSARAHRERASAALALLIGAGAESDLEIDDSLGMPSKPLGDISASPALIAAERAIAAASSQVSAAQAARLPTFQVALSTGFLGVDPPATVGHNFGASYDGVISVPLFEGGLIQSQIDQAKAREHSARAQLRQTTYLLSQRLADASLRYDQATEALGILTRSLPTADDAFALSWSRFLGGGNATILEVVDAYSQAEGLRLARIDQQFAIREAAAEVDLLSGRLGA